MAQIVPTITTSDPNTFVTNLTKLGSFAKRIQVDRHRHPPHVRPP